jgi:hypothetical protein
MGMQPLKSNNLDKDLKTRQLKKQNIDLQATTIEGVDLIGEVGF